MKKFLMIAVSLALVGCYAPVSDSDIQLAISLCEPHSGVSAVERHIGGELYVICKTGLWMSATQLVKAK